jgi:hypothetical protein
MSPCRPVALSPCRPVLRRKRPGTEPAPPVARDEANLEPAVDWRD